MCRLCERKSEHRVGMCVCYVKERKRYRMCLGVCRLCDEERERDRMAVLL